MKSIRRWTVVLVPPGAGHSRSVRIPARMLHWMTAAGAVLALAAMVFGYATVTKSLDLTRLDRLERTNEILAQELDLTHRQLVEFSDTLDLIAARDRQVRLLAGLEPTDAEMQLAGIGGPIGAWTEREQLLSQGPVGQVALDMRLDVGTLLRRANLLAGSFQVAVDTLETVVDRLTRTPSIMPTAGFLSSGFAQARQHPIFHEERAHPGIDISAPMGTPILASAGGRVIYIGTQAGYGKILTIDHGYGVVTRYAHCSRMLVRVGQRVSRGEEIALVGNTGIVTAPHLHYEVIVDGREVDPKTFMFPEIID